MESTASAYEVAVEFIRLGDIHRTFERAHAQGWDGAESERAMSLEMVECRYRLDKLLGTYDWKRWTNAEWNALVKKRLTTTARPIVAVP